MRAELALWAVALLLLAFALGGDAGPAAPAPPPTRPVDAIRVVTWNVGGAEGGKGRRMNDESLPAITQTLRTLDPDLCFLQEVGHRDRLRRLAEALGDGWQARMRGDVGRTVGVLYRRGTLSPVKLDDAGPGAMGVILESDAGTRVGAVGVHANAWSSSPRNRTIGLAVDHVHAMLHAGVADVGVLAGDLNLDLDLGSRHDLFTDDEYRDVETYNYVAARLHDAALGAGSTAEPDRRLDYVFVSDGTVVRHAAPWKGQRAPGMDHDPLVVDLLAVSRRRTAVADR